MTSPPDGFGWTPQQTALEIESLTSRFRVLPEPRDVFAWFDLVQRYSISGKHAHDLRLGACAKEWEFRLL